VEKKAGFRVTRRNPDRDSSEMNDKYLIFLLINMKK
jgi:hypothetical protein